MPAFLLPILAQTLLFTAGERTELRYLANVDPRAEGEARAFGAATFTSRHSTVGVGYAPGVLISPLSEIDKSSFTQTGTLRASTSFVSRRTTLGLLAGADYTQTNQQAAALGAPPPNAVTQPTGAPDQPPSSTTGQPPQVLQVAPGTIRYASARGGAIFSDQFSRTTTLGVLAAYQVVSGVDDSSRKTQPLQQGPQAFVTLAEQVSKRDSLNTTLDGRYVKTTVDERQPITPGLAVFGDAAVVDLSERLVHQFNRRSSGDVDAGVAYTWTRDQGGKEQQAVYPIAHIGYRAVEPYHRGELSLRIESGYAPVVDRTTTAIDSRLISGALVAWDDRRHVLLSASVASTLSLSRKKTGALNDVSATASAAYRFGHGFRFEGGVRAAYQLFQGVQTVPPTAAFFVALTWTWTSARQPRK